MAPTNLPPERSRSRDTAPATGRRSGRRRRWVLFGSLLLFATIGLSLAGAGLAGAAPVADDADGWEEPDHVEEEEPNSPDELDGREVVENPDEMPYSAIGQLNGGSGVLVSEYHVLTNAHVVTDDDGNVHEQHWFKPGYRNPPDGPKQPHFGQAHASAEDVEVHPDYFDEDGDTDGRADLAIVELDRPVGRAAGYMDVGGWSGDPESFDLEQAGYIDRVTGNRQLSSDPTYVRNFGSGSVAAFEACAPIDHGDSGSPIWRTVDGEPTVVGTPSRFQSPDTCDTHLIKSPRLEGEQLELVESWIGDPQSLDAHPQLIAAQNVNWVENSPTTPTRVSYSDTDVEFSTTIYNNGGVPVDGSSDAPAESSTVEFSIERSEGEVVTLCTDEIEIGAYESARANCTVSDLPEFDIDTEPELFVTTMANRKAEQREMVHYDTESHDDPYGPQPIGSVAVEPATIVRDVSLSGLPQPGESFEVDVTVDEVATDLGTYEDVVELDAELASCDPDSVPVTFEQEFGADVPAETVTFTCEDQRESYDEALSYDLTVSTDDRTVSEPYGAFMDEPRFYAADLRPNEDGTVGQEDTVTAEVVNVGRHGTAEVALDNEQKSDRLASQQVTIDSGAREEVEFSYTPSSDAVGKWTYFVETFTDEDVGASATTVVHEPLKVTSLEAPSSIGTDAESVDVEAEVRNPSPLPQERRVRLQFAGETVTERTVSLGEGESTTISGTASVSPSPGDEYDVSAEAYQTTAWLSTTETVSVEGDSSQPDCVEVGEEEPCDLDGDGLYRDMTGDESVGQTDVVVFFQHQHREAWKQPDMFDFSGDGSVGHGDVIALFEYVALH